MKFLQRMVMVVVQLQIPDLFVCGTHLCLNYQELHHGSTCYAGMRQVQNGVLDIRYKNSSMISTVE